MTTPSHAILILLGLLVLVVLGLSAKEILGAGVAALVCAALMHSNRR